MSEAIVDEYYMQQRKYREWVKSMPVLEFPRGMAVKIIPPFAGAAIRFVAKQGEASVSVYLDMDDSLGFMQQPYWEASPGADGEPDRYPLEDWRKMLADVQKTLRRMNRKGGEA